MHNVKIAHTHTYARTHSYTVARPFLDDDKTVESRFAYYMCIRTRARSVYKKYAHVRRKQ